MKEYLRKKIKQEKASATLLVFVTVLTFVAVLSGAFLTVTILRKSQIQSDIRIQEIYKKDVERVDEIYDELIAKRNNRVNCDITYTIDNDKIEYKILFDKNVRNFIMSDIKLYSGSKITSSIASSVTLSTSNPAYSTQVSSNSTYIVSFDYKCINSSQEFEVGLYSDTDSSLPTKKLTATSTTQHESYLVKTNNDTANLKLLAQIESSNDVNISNFEIIKLDTTTTVTNQSFTMQDDEIYLLNADYDSTLRYAIIIERGVCEDFSGNPNVEKIQVI